jgi:ABC-type transport system, involved in lipoprotein release, permease component
MNNIRLTLFNVAKMNIKRQPLRTSFLGLLIFILAFVLFSGTFLVKSLNDGLVSLSDRLGADIIVVPQGYDSKIEGALLRGEPNTFYFDAEAVDRIKKIEGVANASPQLFIATLSAGCCSFPLQIIGIDFETDFNVKPWLSKHLKLPLTNNEIVVGSNIVGNVRGEVKFFNQPFVIAARLSKTGMGFDNSVFMTMENARRLSKEYERIMQHPIAHNERLISSVMVKLKTGFSAKKVSKKILEAFKGEGVYPLTSKQMMSNISAGIETLTLYIRVLIITLYILSFVVLIVSFSSIFNERRGEFAMMRIIGARKTWIALLAGLEAFIISSISAFLGTVTSLFLILLFNQAIVVSLKMPFLSPSLLWIMLTSIGSFLAISLIAPISSLRLAFKLAKTEIAIGTKGL